MSKWPLDWRVSSLEELASHITSGGTPTSGSPRYYSETGGLPFAKTEDLTRAKSKFLDDCELYVTAAALRESAAKKYPIGTILVSMYGTIGLTKITDCELAANQALCALIPPFTCDRDYLYQHLDFIRPDWLRFSGQTTQANINGAAVRAREVPLPPVSEQRAIAQILDTLDTAIRDTEALIDKLKAVKQGLLYDLLTRGIDANGQLRPPQSEAPQLYKESQLGWIPREWEFSLLANISAKIGDGVHYAVERSHEGVPFLFVSCIRNGKIDWHDASFVSQKTYQEISKRSKPVKGMVLFTVVGSYGHAAHVDDDSDFGFERNIAFLTPNSKYLHSKYLLYSMSSEATRAQVERLVIGNAQKVLTLSALNSIIIPLPSLTEQAQIFSRLDTLTERQDHERSMLEKLSAQKRGLMDDLLTGRVRVTPLLESMQPSAAPTEV